MPTTIYCNGYANANSAMLFLALVVLCLMCGSSLAIAQPEFSAALTTATATLKKSASDSVKNTLGADNAYAVQSLPATVPTTGAPITAKHLAEDRLLPVDVTVNEAPGGQWLLLQRNEILYAPEEAFVEWRLLRTDNIQHVKARGRTWLALSFLPGFAAHFNAADQSIALTFSVAAFQSTTLADEPAGPIQVTPAASAAFVNYDLNFSGSQVRLAPYSQNFGALIDVGVSGQWGVLTSSYIGQNLIGDQTRSVRRLETLFNKDFPDTNTTLRVGDSTTHLGAFNSSFNFTGIQLTRNFSLRPGFVTQPIPVLFGTSSTPSTIDLYVNEILRQTTRVPTGPFTIDNLPLITESGEARLVVKDALGRETVLMQPFFTHADLLEQGLSDWSVELGKIRRNLGTDNANYGPSFASGLWRQGLNKQLTAQAELKWSANTHRLSGGAVYALPFQSLGLFEIARSRDQVLGQGKKWALGFEKSTSTQRLTWRIEGAGRTYREIDWESNTLPNRLQISSSYSYTSTRFGAMSVAYARTNVFDQGYLSTMSASYAIRLGPRGSASLTANRVVGKTSGYTIGLSLLFALEKGITLTSNTTQTAGQTDTYVSASRPLMTDVGTSWRALSGTKSGVVYGEGGVYYQGNKGQLSADVSASAAQKTWRLGAQGGAVLMDKRFFAARRIENSFALVEVPHYPGIKVSFQGNNAMRTDKNGVLMLTNLQAYQNNRIQLDASELPLNAEIDNLEQVAVPAAHTGVKITFPVRTGRAALIRILFDDGQPAPVGAEIKLMGDQKDFFVARHGQTFITGLEEKNTLRLKWNDHYCDLSITLPPEKSNDITRLGPLTCLGVPR